MAWEDRQPEVAYLLNPAYCAILLAEAARGHSREVNRGLPFALSLLVLPIALHGPTREGLPRTLRTSLHVWVRDHPHTRVGFAQRVRALIPYSKEAILLGLQAGRILIDGSGDLIAETPVNYPSSWERGTDASQCANRALFLGRWFAHSGSVATVYASWGIQP